MSKHKKKRNKPGPPKKHGPREPKIKKVLRQAVIAYLSEHPDKEYNHKQLAAQFQIEDTQTRQVLISVLEEMRNQDMLESPERGKYKYRPQLNELSGVLQVSSKGVGFVSVVEQERDIYIAPPFLADAFDGDTVEVRIVGFRQGRSPEGEVVKVVQRARELFVGVMDMKKTQAFMVPDSQKIHADFFIPQSKLNGASNGQKVVVRLTDWPKDSDSPIGEVVDVLGAPGLNEVEMNAIMVEYGLPLRFPSFVEDHAARIPLEISEDEIRRRRDFREILTFTIDPDDAKDFDDALSFVALEDGWYQVGVHIADVSHYVTPDSPIEKEAYVRATSVYLVDRVIPMLPEVLSNKVCSLRPNEEKLCFSAVFEMNDAGDVRSEWFGRTVIFSRRRFTYDEAQQVIETGKGDMNVAITTLDRIAKTLRKQRLSSGALEIESTEVKFKLDEKGNPTGVYIKTLKDANKLIEEFMLLANRKVSEFIGKPDGKKVVRPSVYRIHDSPAEDKLETLTQFIATFGYRLSGINQQNAASKLNGLLRDIKGKPEEHTIRTMIIRSMAKAVYSTENIGHYGLAFQYYSHFTSPIRRYPDLMLHRILQDKLDNAPASNEGLLEKACIHSSNRERMAAEAERASIKYKQVQYLEQFVGDAFEAVITSVVNWGFYVELADNFCEGLVSINSLTDDTYAFDSKLFAIVGRKHRKTYKIGDKVDVIVNRVDLLKKEVDLILPEEY
jgi:ribonuclease R